MALMAMPTSAAAIGSILAVISEMTLTTNPIVDNTTATSQTHQLFIVTDRVLRQTMQYTEFQYQGVMNNASNSVKIGPLACAIAVSSVVITASKVKAPAIIKRTVNIVRPVGLCVVRSLLLLLLLILVMCIT
jgi:hypothetical protein